MPQLLGLIFDLDGTLVDSAADLRQALNTLLAAHGRRALSQDEVKGMIGDGMHTLLHRAFAATGAEAAKDKNLFDEFLTHYQNQTASAEQLYPGVIETLRSFRAKGVRIGLCTNKLYQPTLKLLHEIGIADQFDFIAGADTFDVFKPHPGHVLGVAKGMKIPPAYCAMVGDSTNDIRAAKGAKVAAIAVSHGYGDVDNLSADTVISGFAELPDALRRLGFDLVG